jgi:hypothetical protein
LSKGIEQQQQRQRQREEEKYKNKRRGKTSHTHITKSIIPLSEFFQILFPLSSSPLLSLSPSSTRFLFFFANSTESERKEMY